MQRVSTLFTERQTTLFDAMHLFVADWAVIIRTGNTFFAGRGLGRRGRFTSGFCVRFTDTSMGDRARSWWRFCKDGLKFTAEGCSIEVRGVNLIPINKEPWCSTYFWYQKPDAWVTCKTVKRYISFVQVMPLETQTFQEDE
jgi:hypothetical protein